MVKLIDACSLSQKKCKVAISCRLDYATNENFLGRIVSGYDPNYLNVGLISPKAAEALCGIQNELLSKHMSLHIFDSYRPLRAVKDFGEWMLAEDVSLKELERKAVHYPHLDKKDLEKLGYVAGHVSNHCFGDTVDLSILDLQTATLINMGTIFDYFDTSSYANAPSEEIGEEAYDNRRLLAEVMQKFGFTPYEKEYWHFTFQERENQNPLDITWHEYFKSRKYWENFTDIS